MIRNKFASRCKCGIYVQSGEGFVHERKITCAKCIPEPLSRPFSVEYQGCDHQESMSEYFYDNFHNESDFLGFDVGSQ